jgi:DNA-binding XRE family transcriptional regulator
MGKDTTFAGRLKVLRRKAGLTQYALARKAGLSRQSLNQLERGDSEPAWQTVQLLALALGVATEEFRDMRLTLPDVEVRPRGRPRGRRKGV